MFLSVRKSAIATVFCFFLVAGLFSLGNNKNLEASLAELPGLAEAPGKGAFVDLVKAIDEVYTDGTITIRIFPFTRSVFNVINGLADFHVPTVRNPNVDQSALPYKTVTVPMGSVCFVIYSNIANPVTKQMLDSAIARGNDIPYKIEVPGGIENQFPFNCATSNDITQSLNKLAMGRIDALVWAQEEVDTTLKDMRLKNIKRAFWMNFDDAIIIPKGADGDRIDAILSEALSTLKKTGKLNKVYANVHHPYNEWQPADMGW